MRFSAEPGLRRPPAELTSCSQDWSGHGSRSLSLFSEGELSHDSLTDPNRADKAEEHQEPFREKRSSTP